MHIIFATDSFTSLELSVNVPDLLQMHIIVATDSVTSLELYSVTISRIKSILLILLSVLVAKFVLLSLPKVTQSQNISSRSIIANHLPESAEEFQCVT